MFGKKKKKKDEGPSKLHEVFMKNLRIIRRKKGMTQIALSERMEWAPCMVSDYERGRRCPTLKTIEKFAKHLNVKAYHLLQE